MLRLRSVDQQRQRHVAVEDVEVDGVAVPDQHRTGAVSLTMRAMDNKMPDTMPG